MEDIRLTEKRGKLLEILGKKPDLTLKQLADMLDFKNHTYIPRIVKQLRGAGYLSYPFYEIEYRKICRNRLTLAAVIALFKRDYRDIMAILKRIDSYLRFYPIFEQSFKKFVVTFLSSDIRRIKEIMDYLVKKGIFKYYDFYRQDGKFLLINPTFYEPSSGNPTTTIPKLNNLLEETEIPDLRWEKFSGTKLNFCDLRLLEDLEAGIGECKLPEIQIFERNIKRNNFSYSQLKESFKKLSEKGLIKKKYYVYPIPKEKCYRFLLLLRSDDFEKTRRLVFNFGKNARIQRSVSYWISYTDKKIYGMIQCMCDPLFLLEILRKLDTYEAIKEKKFYFLRSYPANYWASQSITTDYYDYENQTLHYPYKKYLAEIKEVVDSISSRQ